MEPGSKEAAMFLPSPAVPPARSAIVRGIVVIALALAGGAVRAQDAVDRKIADHLAEMLRSARSVISDEQPRINDPSLADKGLDGKTVLHRSVELFRRRTHLDPYAIDPASREGRLLRAQMEAIVEVVNANQSTINRKGLGFKGFIPAVFGRLIDEAFAKRAGGEAEVKVTAPPDLVRNRRARPDAWEAEVIATKFQSPSWKRGEPFAATVTENGRQAFRIMVPEYYKASCLTCHGTPRGELDITGYQKEGLHEQDLAGVISITLRR
jgi:hypothetical protein